MLEIDQVGTLQVKLLVLLLEQRQVLLQFKLLLRGYFALHPAQSLLLGLLCNFTFEALSLDALLQHADLVPVKGLNIVDHRLLLLFLLSLSLPELPLLLQQLILLQITGQLVHLLTQPDLLGIPLIHQRLLLVEQLLLELLLPQRRQLHLSLLSAFGSFLLGHLYTLFRLDGVVLLAH